MEVCCLAARGMSVGGVQAPERHSEPPPPRRGERIWAPRRNVPLRLDRLQARSRVPPSTVAVYV
eukprot:COSAG02_NODE_37058_length_447_cov_0.617816_1_plen_63_part_10